MEQLNEVVKVIGGMSGGALALMVVLAGFALAGFAIYAVLTLAKERR